MKRIMLPRGEGKTQQLIELSEKTGAYIICMDSRHQMVIANRANSQGRNIPTPITYEEFLDKMYYHRGIKGFLLDNADQFIQYVAGSTRIVAITLNTNDPKDPDPSTLRLKPDVKPRYRGII